MEKERRLILTKVRNYLFEHPSSNINMQEISRAVDCRAGDITEWATRPDALIEQILELKSIELAEVLNIEKYAKESAIDSMIISGQEIYEKFELLSPVKYVFIKKIKPDLYQNCRRRMFELIEQHLHYNLDKGIKTGEYKADINVSLVVEKYAARLKTIHSEDYLSTEHFSFANTFSNIFENYVEEVATNENWNYFRKRKLFYEAISFNKPIIELY